MSLTPRQSNYVYSDDSDLLRRAISKLEGESLLEIGVGNAGVLTGMGSRFKFLVGTDLLRPVRGNSEVNFLRTDRATCFRDCTFEVVAFNPPYMPSSVIEDVTVDGGPGGISVPISFLEDALRVLRPDGRILMVLSSHCKLDKLFQFCTMRQLKIRKIEEKKLFFETLYVFEIRKNLSNPQVLEEKVALNC